MSDGTLFAAGPALKPTEFEKIRQLARAKFGLDLKPGKETLVLSRLGRKLREGGFASFGDYVRHVTQDPTGDSLVALIDALTTNYTSFFREQDHFEFLRNTIVPQYRDRRELRVWCAAAATGEEPYSLAITLLETVGRQVSPGIRVTASDISTRALATAERGVYSGERFTTMPAALRQRYLTPENGGAETRYQMRPEVRTCVEFRRINLIETYRHAAPYPVIFCRNVMIYFDQATRQSVVSRLLEWLEPGGYLFVGHAESLGDRAFPLEYIRPAVYRKHGGSSRGGRVRGTR